VPPKFRVFISRFIRDVRRFSIPRRHIERYSLCFVARCPVASYNLETYSEIYALSFQRRVFHQFSGTPPQITWILNGVRFARSPVSLVHVKNETNLFRPRVWIFGSGTKDKYGQYYHENSKFEVRTRLSSHGPESNMFKNRRGIWRTNSSNVLTSVLLLFARPFFLTIPIVVVRCPRTKK